MKGGWPPITWLIARGSIQGHHSEPSAIMPRSATHQRVDGRSSLDIHADWKGLISAGVWDSIEDAGLFMGAFLSLSKAYYEMFRKKE